MRIALAAVGTTGDVRPFAALASALTARGHPVTAVSWELHRSAFDATGAAFAAAGPATTVEEIRHTAIRAGAERNPMAQVAVLRDFHMRDAVGHYRQLREALAGHDLVLLHGVHSLAEAAARDAGLRWATAVFDPTLLPTASASPPGMPGLGPLNRAGWWLVDRMLRRLDEPLHAELRSAGSRSAEAVTIFRARSPLLHLVGASPLIAQVPADLPPTVSFTGAWLPAAEPDPLSAELGAFLDAGPAPVVVTFGSMAFGADGGELAAVCTDALARTSLRGVVQAGAADLHGTDDDRVRFIGPADHRALFSRAALVVHHGGAGTSHAAVAAGVPSVAVPHIGDQSYWAARLRRIGVAPRPLPARRLRADRLAARIHDALEAGKRQRAITLGERLRSEDGVATAIGLIEGLG